MSLQIIAGSSGSGKSHTAYQSLLSDAIRHPEQDFYVIVPEQFTMQTQSDLVEMHPRHGLVNVDVLSFNRLAFRIFEEVGGGGRPVLDDLGKTLILQKVITKQRKDLQLLAGTLEKAGSVEEMKSLISELLQYRVGPDDLAALQDLRSAMLAMKLDDIRAIYRAFLDALQDKYLTTEEVPERLCAVIGDFARMRGSTVVLDGFTGFTPVQLQVVRELLKICRSVTVLVTADPRVDLYRKGGAHRLFHMSCRMVQQLTELAAGIGCEVLPIVKPQGSRFSDNPALAHLEQNLFRYRSTVYEKAQDAVRIHAAGDPRAEVRFARCEIRRLVREQGYHWRDFAIVTGDLETYGRAVRDQFEQEEIPYFLDQKQNVLAEPCVEFIRAAVDLIVRGFTYASVFRFLRCGLADFTQVEVDRMETYVLATGVRGWKQYTAPWTRTTRQIGAEALPELNALRARFVEMLEAYTEGMRRRGATLREKAEVLYGLLAQQRIQQKLAGMEERFARRGDALHEMTAAQIYGKVMGLLDKIVEILGEEKAGNAAFAQLLDAGFSEMRIGLIPPGEDRVMVGDITRTRLAQVKVLFLLGVNEGVVPQKVKERGLLSEADRTALAQREITLAPDAREVMCQQRFYLYLTMTKPSDRLYLSYSEVGADGATMLPSYLIGAVLRLYEGLEIRPVDSLPLAHRLEGRDGAIRGIINGLQDLDVQPPTDTLLELVRAQADARENVEPLLAAADAHCATDGISAETARALYGDRLYGSATRLERYAACAFRHFAAFGLALRERELYEFTAADMGNVMHAALEHFTVELQRQGRSLRDLAEEERDARADAAVDAVVQTYGNTILYDSARRRHRIDRIRRIMRRTVWALQEQLARGAFEPEGSELDFGTERALEIDLGDGALMRLVGRIDRVDACETDAARYVRIIDYKTGQTQLALDKLYHGLQMQLMLYLNATLAAEEARGDKRVEPAGAYYYNIDDPILSLDGSGAKDLLTALKMDGLSRAESEVYTLLDGTLAPGGKSDVIQMQVKQDGDLASNAHAARAEDFAAIRTYTEEKARAFGRAIMDGSTEIAPCREENTSACTHCPYKGVCGFDERIPGYRYRRLKKMDRADALAAIRDAVNGGEA